MNNKDIISMYEKGYSIDYIIKEFYKYKNKYCIKNHYFNETFIITKKEMSKEDCKKFIYNLILNRKNSPVSNKAN